MNGMTESMQILVDLLTAAAALGAFGVGLWNAYQFGKLSARVDTLETANTTRTSTPRLCTDRRAPVPVTAARRGIERGIQPFHVAAGPRFSWVPARRSCSPARSAAMCGASPVIASRSPLQEPFELGHSFSEVPELIGRLLALGLGPRGSVPTR